MGDYVKLFIKVIVLVEHLQVIEDVRLKQKTRVRTSSLFYFPLWVLHKIIRFELGGHMLFSLIRINIILE